MTKLDSATTNSKKEYLAWVNGGMMGTSWRAETIEEAVKTCISVAAQDWSGLRGSEVAVCVYDITGHDIVMAELAGRRGQVLTEEEKELTPLVIVKVDVPTLLENGNAHGEHYQSTVRQAAHYALRKVPEKWREEQITAVVLKDWSV